MAHVVQFTSVQFNSKTYFSVGASVGIDGGLGGARKGSNFTNDVMLVQFLLNRLAGAAGMGFKELTVDGIYGPRTDHLLCRFLVDNAKDIAGFGINIMDTIIGPLQYFGKVYSNTLMFALNYFLFDSYPESLIASMPAPLQEAFSHKRSGSDDWSRYTISDALAGATLPKKKK